MTTNIIHMHKRKLNYYTGASGRQPCADGCLQVAGRSQCRACPGAWVGAGCLLLLSASLVRGAGNYDQYTQTRAELEENQMKQYKWEQEQIKNMKVMA